jgi:hypothetical protein
MTLWFFQLSEKEYPLRDYRLHVWEGERWRFFARSMVGADTPSVPGDAVVFFYVPTGAAECGFVGWGVGLQWVEHSEEREVCFRPAAPNDFLKMHPWGDEHAIQAADAIRGPMKQRTLWPAQETQAATLRKSIGAWRSGRTGPGA